MYILLNELHMLKGVNGCPQNLTTPQIKCDILCFLYLDLQKKKKKN